MKAMQHYRLASKAAGDDVSLTRYVRVDREQEVHKPRVRGRQKRLQAPGLVPDYVIEGRTRYPTRRMRVADMTTLLVSGHSNVKIGRDVRKGRLKGYWIYTLSLEERATCPTKCLHWTTCYGNSAPLAKRIDHTDPGFLPRLEREIGQLCRTRGRKGILIRLHALGDFYSELYVAFWWRMLEKHENLALYGYTARNSFTDPIGVDIAAMNAKFGQRCMIRESDGGWPGMSTVSIGTAESCPPDAFVCPEQTAKTRCCATCGACWSTAKNVAFVSH